MTTDIIKRGKFRISSGFALMMAKASDAVFVTDICHAIRDTKSCIDFMRQKKLIQESMTCERCRVRMVLVERSEKTTKDLEAWKCTKCKSTTSIRAGTVFYVSSH